MRDQYNREITYLRISLTDRCNLRCRYCMPENGICKLDHDAILSLENILEIVREASKLGIKKIRLTGGEPLTRRGIVWLCEQIKALGVIEDLAVTTNGVLLPSFASELKAAGVDRLNISLDTLDAAKYNHITRIGNIEDAKRGIEAAFEAGFKKIKINTVLIGGFNDNEISDFVELTKDRDIDIRFIELMPMPETAMPEYTYIPNSVVLEQVPELKLIGQNGVATMYQKPGYSGRVGLISPISCSFCSECNRIRLTADGFIKPCLHSKDEISIKGLHGEELRDKLSEIIMQKPKEHPALDLDNKSESARGMSKIGG